jgi:hypothetical protein
MFVTPRSLAVTRNTPIGVRNQRCAKLMRYFSPQWA